MERQVSTQPQAEEYFYQRASMIARLGSGSAARSVYPHLAVWGATTLAEGSSNDYAIPFAQAVHKVFLSYHDDILLVSKSEKSVSSTAGHALMNSNPFADVRYQQAHNNLQDLLLAMKEGDLHRFGRIAEQEALQLHALMMTSEPSYILMESNSLEIIKKIRLWRQNTGHPLYFSMDAGPNMHLLYPDNIASAVQLFIQQELLEYCEQGSYLEDVVGKGPTRL
jgi:diphosphomevalonate decarboxylase